MDRFQTPRLLYNRAQNSGKDIDRLIWKRSNLRCKLSHFSHLTSSSGLYLPPLIVEVTATVTTPMFAVLLDALLFDEVCHHLATTTPLRFNAANDSFLKLSFCLLCTLLFVTVAEITNHVQVQITWRCISVGDTSRRLVAPFSLQCFSLTGMGADPLPSTRIGANRLPF